jgi:predicted ester cyclase
MTVEQTERTMRAYLETLLAGGDFAAYFADDVEWTTMESGEVVRGRAAVDDLIRSLHQQIFEASPELRTLVCGDGTAAVEATFRGRHIGELAGVAPTGVDVQLPYTVFYDIDGDRITRLRAYFAVSALVAQVQAAAGAAAAGRASS